MPLVGRLADRYGGGPLALAGVIVTTVATIPFALIGAHTPIEWLSRGDGRARDGRRARLHARDDCRVRLAQALGALRRDAAAERAAAGRRLDRNRGARRRAAARPGRRDAASDDAAAAYGTAFWWSVGITAVAIVPCLVLVRAERAARRAAGSAATPLPVGPSGSRRAAA